MENLQTLVGNTGVVFRGNNRLFTTSSGFTNVNGNPTFAQTLNNQQVNIELDNQVVLFDVTETTVDNVSYANTTTFVSALDPGEIASAFSYTADNISFVGTASFAVASITASFIDGGFY